MISSTALGVNIPRIPTVGYMHHPIGSLSSITCKHVHNMSAVRPNLKEPVLLQCKRCGRERLYKGKNPYRTICTWCGTSLSLSTCRIYRE